jgi:hypothetical protein
MTLKEKINNALFYIEPKISLIKCEEIIDEFAIGFAKWLVIRYNEDIIYDEYTTKELLEIYKKEKGL